jgi:hypothetical protein
MQSIHTPSANDLSLFRLTGEDAQYYAHELIGRDLSYAEMEYVKKYVEHGMECWTEVVELAVQLTVEELGLKPTSTKKKRRA